MKTRLVQSLAATILALCLAGPLYADRRTYEASVPMGELVARVVDQISETGLRLRVDRVFDEDSGKHGFQFTVLNRGTTGEIRFYQDEDNANRSLLRVITQDPLDSRRLHDFLVSELNLKEVGVTEIGDANDWPFRP